MTSAEAAGFDVIAHRGASAYAPEHSWPAYELAMEMGVDFLEPDLQMTADGELVAFHDPTLDRTASPPGGGRGERARGAVRELTLEELRRLEVGRWFNERHPERARPGYEGLTVVTFEELLERWGDRVGWYPEMKNPELTPGMEEALATLLERHGFTGAGEERGRVLVQCFSRAALERFREFAPALPRVQLLGPEAVSDRAVEGVLAEVAEYAQGVGPHHRLVDARFLEAAHIRGLLVHPWTVDDPAEMDRLIGLGVDGLFTNAPDRLLEKLGRRP